MCARGLSALQSGRVLQGTYFAALLWPHRNAVGNRISQQLVHRRIRVGIHTRGGEVAVAGIAHQQALTLQIPGNALRNGMSELGEFIAGRRLNPADDLVE